VRKCSKIFLTLFVLFFVSSYAFGLSDAFKKNVYDPGQLKPIDSKLKVKVGEKAPNFTLPSLSGEKISLSQFEGKKNVVISFVPAAWTPVCSDQWPGYNLAKVIFEKKRCGTFGDYGRQHSDPLCLDQSDGESMVSGSFRFLAPW